MLHAPAARTRTNVLPFLILPKTHAVQTLLSAAPFSSEALGEDLAHPPRMPLYVHFLYKVYARGSWRYSLVLGLKSTWNVLG